MCVCVCTRACVRACVHACVHPRASPYDATLSLPPYLLQSLPLFPFSLPSLSLFLSSSLSLPADLYTQKDVRVHLQRLKELLTVDPLQQALTYSDGMSLSLLAAITLKDPEGEPGEEGERKSLPV